MNVRMTEGALVSGHRGIRQRQQGGSNSIKMPDGNPCPALLPFPAIVILLTLMKRGVSSSLKATSEPSAGYGSIKFLTSCALATTGINPGFIYRGSGGRAGHLWVRRSVAQSPPPPVYMSKYPLCKLLNPLMNPPPPQCDRV